MRPEVDGLKTRDLARATPLLARRRWAGIVSATLTLVLATPAHAAIKWKGYDWNVTQGGMAGVAAGSQANVSIDAAGYLHLRIAKNSGVWTASELFSAQTLGFGSYQWQLEGPVDTFDKQIVLGLFPYGPTAGIGADGTNEIDIEWARWGQATGENVSFTNYPASGKTVGTKAYQASLGGGTSSTARFTWSSQYIESAVLKGYQALGSETGLLAKWRYAPANPSTNIPQQALPLGMNLWCFEAPPTDGQDLEIVVRDFQFVKEGDPLPGTGGSGSGTGGSATGGMATGGSATGGTATGGSATGGSANGSSADSGAGTGGTARGGSANSGSANGGSANGGSANGGSANGGSPSEPSAGRPEAAVAGNSSAPAGGGGAHEPPRDAGGCSCSTPRSASPGVWLLGPGLLWLALRRRRVDRPE